MDLGKLKNYADKAKYEDTLSDRSFVAAVVGVTFEGRQEVLKEVAKETEVKLERERRNPYDFFAVRVMVKINGSWQQAGYLPKKMSRKVANSIDNGVSLEAKVWRLLGGYNSEATGEFLNRGLEVVIEPKR